MDTKKLSRRLREEESVRARQSSNPEVAGTARIDSDVNYYRKTPELLGPNSHQMTLTTVNTSRMVVQGLLNDDEELSDKQRFERYTFARTKLTPEGRREMYYRNPQNIRLLFLHPSTALRLQA